MEEKMNGSNIWLSTSTLKKALFFIVHATNWTMFNKSSSKNVHNAMCTTRKTEQVFRFKINK